MSKDFSLGMIIVTKEVKDLMNEDTKFKNFVNLALGKHSNRDWGKISPEDKQKNDEATVNGERIVSSYRRSGMQKDDPHARILIITEADRSVTTILFAEEY